jgi:hypothetical protein
MADNTTKVTYQAAANFSALSRAITNLRRQIKGLRDDQAAFNAESAAGSLSAAAASDRNTKSTQAESAALSDTKGIIEGVTAALTNAIKARDDHAAASKQMSDSDKAATGTSQALEGAVGRVESALGKAASAFDRATAASKRNRSENNQNTSSQTKLISGTQRVLGAFQKLGSYKPDIVPPFIALIPALAGVIALVNPLIGGLASVAAAAGGFASNIGSLAGAALGVVPALAGLLSLVGALKVAFGGIGNVFKQYSAMKKATGGGGGGGGGGDKQIEISQAEKVARANEKYAESIQNVQFAEEDLTAARKDYIQRLNELQKAVDRAAASQKRAAANEQLAQENYANVLADPGSTKGQKMDAAVSVTEAKESVQDTNDTNKQNAADLAAMKKTGINGDRQVIEAQRAVTQAIYDERDAQIAVLNAQKGTTAAAGAGAAATAAYQDALDKLSPSARSVVLQLIAMQGAWDKLQRTVQEAFFSKVVGDIQLLRKLFPPVTSLLSDFAGVAGTVADTFLKMVTSTAWTDDIVTFGKEASPAVKDIGDGLMNILNGFRNIAIAALPFTKEIIKDLVGITEKFKNFTDTARANGSMAAFLETVRARLERWGRILINVGTIVLNYGRALSGLGDDLTKALEKTTGSWAKSSQSAAAKGSPFQKYLHDIKPLLKNINGLIGDFFGWLGKTASSKGFIGQMNDIVTVFRKDLGPAIGDILDTLSKTGIGTSLVKTIGAIVKTISTVLDNGGATALKTFFGFLQKIVELIGKAASLPGGGAVIATLVTSLGALAAITFVGKFTGLFTLFGWLLRIAKSGPVSALFKNLKGLGKVKGPDGTYSSGRGETTKTSKIDKGSKGGSAAGDVAGALESGAGNETKTSTSRAAQAARGAATSDIERSAERAAGRSGLAGRVIGGAASLALGGGAARAVSAARGAGSAVARGARDVEHYSETVDRGHFTATPLKTARRGLSGAYKITDAAEAVGKAGRGARALGLLGRGAMTAARGVGVGALASVAGEIGGDAIANGAPKGSRGASRRVGGAILSGTASGAGTGATFGAGVGSIVPGIGTAVGAGAGAAIGGAVGGASAFFAASPKDKAKFLADLKSFFTKDVPAFLAGIGPGVWKGLQSFDGWLTNGWAAAQKWFANLPYAAGYAVGQLWGDVQNLGDWLVSTWNSAGKYLQELPGNVVRNAGNIWRGLKNLGAWWTETAWPSFVGFIKSLPGNIVRNAGNIWRGLKSLGTWWKETAWPGFLGYLKGLPHQVSSNAGNIWSGLKSLGGWIGDRTRELKNWAVGLPGQVGGWVGNLFSNVAAGFAAGNADTHPAAKKSSKKKKRHNGGPIFRDDGGTVPGSGNSDTVPAMLTPGEFVVRKAIVARFGADNFARLNSGVLSYAQLLQRQIKSGKITKAEASSGVEFLTRGQLVPGRGSSGFPGGTVSAPVRTPPALGGSSGTQSVTYYVTVNNPVPEKASESLPKSIRKSAYISSVHGQ